MQRTYKVKWAEGLAFKYLKLHVDAEITIIHDTEAEYEWSVVFSTLPERKPDELKVQKTGNLVAHFTDPISSDEIDLRAMMTEWEDFDTGKWSLIGEMFIGDPDGAGGFGGGQAGG